MLGATGPASFDCWGLVRYVQRERFGREMPPLSIGDAQLPEQLKSIQQLARRSKWKRQVHVTPEDGDILLMHSLQGPHVGVAIFVDSQPRILHAVGSVTSPGSVVHSSLPEIQQFWSSLELWHHIEDEK